MMFLYKDIFIATALTVLSNLAFKKMKPDAAEFHKRQWKRKKINMNWLEYEILDLKFFLGTLIWFKCEFAPSLSPLYHFTSNINVKYLC